MSDDGLRILRVTNSIYPEVMGGVGLHTHHMSRVQAEMGHDVTVLTSDNGDRTLTRREERDGYELLRHRELARPLDNSIVPGIVRTFRRLKRSYDVVHLHSHLYFSSNVAAVLSMVSDTPVVLTNHGLVSQTAPEWVQRVFNPTLGKFTFEAADCVLCYTETDRDRLRDRGVESRIEVIHNGIDCTQFRSRDRDSKNQILFVGRLKGGKRPQDVVQAFATVSNEFPDLSLKLVGDGPLRADLERQAASAGLEDRVEFAGEVPNDHMPALYDESIVFVLPSTSEGLPRTVLEAMACETPVVTSDLPQLRPIVEGAGHLVERRSPDELARQLGELLRSPDECERLGATGRKRVEQNYSWRETVRETVHTYHDVIEC